MHTQYPSVVDGDDEYKEERLCSAPWEDRGKRVPSMYQEPEIVHQDSETLTWPWEIVNILISLICCYF